MRFALAVALLALPVSAFAQANLMPAGPIPVHRCVETTAGPSCSPVLDGSGLSAANGYTRAPSWGDRMPAPQAYSAMQPSAPNLTP